MIQARCNLSINPDSRAEAMRKGGLFWHLPFRLRFAIIMQMYPFVYFVYIDRIAEVIDP